MDERDTHKLEGLLKARSDDIGRRRSLRTPRSPAGKAEAAPAPRHRDEAGTASPRICAGCSSGIDPRRLLAMPAATRCLDCQRAFELARAPA